jgi:hypothetical protein
MFFRNPPHTNSVMLFDPEKENLIREKLLVIRDGFVPNENQFVVDTFYVTATYNRENPEEPINGDTMEFILNPPTSDQGELYGD